MGKGKLFEKSFPFPIPLPFQKLGVEGGDINVQSLYFYL